MEEVKFAYRLTDRQLDVIQGLVDGLTMKRIGESLGISERTVETHVIKIKKKLNAESMFELGLKWGIIKTIYNQNPLSPAGGQSRLINYKSNI